MKPGDPSHRFAPSFVTVSRSRTSLREAITGGAVAALFAAVRILSRRRAIALGAAVGRLWVGLRLPRTRVGLENLRVAFPEWSEPRRRRVLREAFANLGRSLAEVPHLRDLTASNLSEVVDVEGLHHLEDALKAAGGAIALTAHFGNWELFAVAMGLSGIPLTIVHRGRDPVLESMLRDWRERGDTTVVPRGSAARATLRALRQHRVVAMLLDQNTPPAEGVFVPFFHRLACTRDAPARIAMRTGVPVVPAFIFRLRESDRHVVRFQPPLELVSREEDPDRAVVENVARMTKAIEDAIRQAPEQWIWNHRRWRTHLDGEARLYRKWGSMRAPLGAAPRSSPSGVEAGTTPGPSARRIEG
jgi:KDO2-lipid IV(A) lauroyltransferase